MIGIGELKRPVTIETPTVAADAGSGGVTTTWATYKTTIAAIEALQGYEYHAAQQVKAGAVVRITMRYDSGVTEQMRVIYGTSIYLIESVFDVEDRRRWLELMCRVWKD